MAPATKKIALLLIKSGSWKPQIFTNFCQGWCWGCDLPMTFSEDLRVRSTCRGSLDDVSSWVKGKGKGKGGARKGWLLWFTPLSPRGSDLHSSALKENIYSPLIMSPSTLFMYCSLLWFTHILLSSSPLLLSSPLLSSPTDSVHMRQQMVNYRWLVDSWSSPV